jgi:hypothetical protein
MKVFTPIFVAAMALASGLGLTGAVSAQNLNCKGDFAQLGNSKGTVLQKCGEPVLKDSFCKPVDRSAASAGAVIVNNCEKVDEWTYNPGYGQFMTMLQFEGGELKRIKYGERVTR